MPLLDTAKRLNKALEEEKKADAKLVDIAALKARRATLYKENGARWFGTLGQTMNDLASEFNSATKNEAKHIKVNRQQPGTIRIELMNPVMNSSVPSSCNVSPRESNLSVICEFTTPAGPQERIFKILPTEAHEIKVGITIKSEIRRVVWPEDEGRKATGDIWDDLRTSTEMTNATKYLDVKEFADYLLDSFINQAW